MLDLENWRENLIHGWAMNEAIFKMEKTPKGEKGQKYANNAVN